MENEQSAMFTLCFRQKMQYSLHWMSDPNEINFNFFQVNDVYHSELTTRTTAHFVKFALKINLILIKMK